MPASVRPSVRFLDDTLAAKIADEAMDVLSSAGVLIENTEALSLLADGGADCSQTGGRVLIPRKLVEDSLASAPSTITMVDAPGNHSYNVGGDNVHFDPGSAGLRIHDHLYRSSRPAVTEDLVRFHRLTHRLDNFHFQSTGLISSDVPEAVSDAYRLFIAFQHCSKPIVTGTFLVEGFRPMAAMLSAIRGGSAELRRRPLAIFDACPSPPLKWTNLTTQSVIDCARAGIPSEFVAMPLTGATSPVTIAGALVQHTAENLAGLVISQLAHAGAPAIFGGSPASFDMRTGTPPMGAIETMMIDSAYAQIGKLLGLPTHAYMGLSDAKSLDTQAGLESGMGTLLAALSGINVVSGGGMMDFESTVSLEKLVIDNEICGMARRMIEGIEQREDPIALHVLKDVGSGIDFLTHPHTLQWLRLEHKFPRVMDRGDYSQWEASGKPSLADRASLEVNRLLSAPAEPLLDPALRHELTEIMLGHGRAFGLTALPSGTG